MNVLVTGAKGMVGRALCANLKNIRDGKSRKRINNINYYIIDYQIRKNRGWQSEWKAAKIQRTGNHCSIIQKIIPLME